jgi:putative ABC transport system ATP-binding protein
MLHGAAAAPPVPSPAHGDHGAPDVHGAHDAAPVVSLRGITRSYPQGEAMVQVLHDISCDVRRGDFVALTGSSGSGKSTLLHILGLLDRPTSGTYLLSGRDTQTLDDDARSDLRGRSIGFVFQNFYLLSYATALENVLLPGAYSATPHRQLHERALHLMEQVGLADRMHHTPARLSGGQQQRVAIARALLHEPDMMLADEPTGQLDSATGTAILDLFARINAGGTTVVIVTHDEKVATAARRRIRMQDGRMVDAA